jgi:hypothetical protein
LGGCLARTVQRRGAGQRGAGRHAGAAAAAHPGRWHERGVVADGAGCLAGPADRAARPWRSRARTTT